MKKLLLFALAIVIMLLSCDGQSKRENKNPQEISNQPQTEIKVNKEYDKDGNLVKYDSTYSYFYSNIEGDSVLRDSIFRDFKSQFNQQYLFSKDPFFNDFFFIDSLLPFDFYRDDFFSTRFKNNMNHMNQLFWEMDSIKNTYFMQQFPSNKHSPVRKM